jgi:hypothetical protein
VQLARLNHLLADFVRGLGVDRQREDAVRAARLLVHQRRSRAALFEALLHDAENLGRALHVLLLNVVDHHALLAGLVLEQAQHALVLAHEVRELLVVELKEGHLDRVLAHALEVFEHGAHCARNHARGRAARVVGELALHRVGLARARLAVRKDGAVESLQHLLDYWVHRVQVHLLLARLRSKHIVEGEGARHGLARHALHHADLLRHGPHSQHRLVALLSVIRRPAADHDAHVDLLLLATRRSARQRALGRRLCKAGARGGGGGSKGGRG